MQKENVASSESSNEESASGDKDALKGLVKDVLSVIVVVSLIGGVLFLFTGAWPPMLAIESGSMEPSISEGDLVIVSDSKLAEETDWENEIVTAEEGAEQDYKSFGRYGDVVVFQPNGDASRVQVIHRAMFWVEEGEDWHDRADEEYVVAVNCSALENCPAPHSGYITRGDGNNAYDQARGVSGPVKVEWVNSKATHKVPKAGWFRILGR